MTMCPEKKKEWKWKSSQSASCEIYFRLKVLIAFSIFHVIYTKQHFLWVPKTNTTKWCSLIRERGNFFFLWWCWLPFISKFYPPESIYMEENYTVYRHINTFNSTLVVVVDDTMHTKIQLTIIWLDVSSFQIQIKLLHREIYPHFTWEFLAVANFSHRARFIPFLLAHLTLAAVNSAVQSFFCPSTWNATNKKFLIYAQSQT